MRVLTQRELAVVVANRCGLDDELSYRAVDAAVDALMQTCPSHVRQHFGSVPNKHVQRMPITAVPELVADVAVTLDIPPGEAFEITAAVCAGLAECWDDADLRAVREAFPVDIAALFARGVEEEPAMPRSHERPRRTLSSGLPGAQHPIATSPPDDGSHTLATGREP